MRDAFLENGLNDARVADGFADESAVANETFRAGLDAGVALDFYHGREHGCRALLADANQFLRERAHLPPVTS